MYDISTGQSNNDVIVYYGWLSGGNYTTMTSNVEYEIIQRTCWWILCNMGYGRMAVPHQGHSSSMMENLTNNSAQQTTMTNSTPSTTAAF